MKDKLKIIENLGISEEQYEEAYNYLYEEFGYAMTMWSYSKLYQEIESYCSIYD